MDRLLALAFGSLLLTSCGSDSDSSGGSSQPPDFGQKSLPSLDTACGGIAGLTGQAILDQRVESFTTRLAYVTAEGDRVDPTDLQIDITWPAAPVAVCYPPYEEAGKVIADSRVSIEGLTLRFKTADGKFDETLPAKAWLPIINGTAQFPQLLAVTTRSNLKGTWQPFPEYAGGTTVSFFTPLQGAQSNLGNGNVGLGVEVPAELDAAIYRGRFAVATWPYNK